MFKVRLFLLSLITFGLPLAGGSRVQAESVQLIDDDVAALQARMDLIASAQSSVDAAYYSVGNDPASHAVLLQLRAAARRGVRVRLVVDAYFNAIPRGMQRHLANEGVEIREYHQPQLLNSDSLLCRLHDKIMVVDSEMLILGGRNVSGAYFGHCGAKNYIDRDVIVAGRVAEVVSGYFHCLWNCRHVKPAHVHIPFPAVTLGDPWPSVRDICTNPDHILSASAARTLDQSNFRIPFGCTQPARAEWPALEVSSQMLCFLHSGRPKNQRQLEISDQIARLITGAQHRVIIETPYFVLWDRMERVLNDVRKRGIPVCILTNSIDSTDNLIVNAELTNQKLRLHQMGVELFEYHGPGILHAKSMIIDDAAVIGSYNLNPRSDYYDTETALVIHSANLAEQLRQSIALHLMQSRPAASHRTIFNHIFPPERAAPNKYLTIQLLRLVTPFIRRHL